MQRRVRAFVATYNRRSGATVLLSSHYMADVEALCRRVIVIHHGRILFDGPLAQLVDAFAAHRTLVVELADPTADLSGYGQVTAQADGRVHLRVPKADAPRVTARVLAELPVIDLTVEQPAVEDVIERVFAEGPA
jgi:ABC-2 type transport system ATP-binding protein